MLVWFSILSRILFLVKKVATSQLCFVNCALHGREAKNSYPKQGQLNLKMSPPTGQTFLLHLHYPVVRRLEHFIEPMIILVLVVELQLWSQLLQKITCPQRSLSPKFFVPKSHCPKNSLSPKDFVPKIPCPQKSLSPKFFVPKIHVPKSLVPKRLCPKN